MDLGAIVDLINNSEPLLCYWAMWESARYCMLSRLRTPFGGPQQVSLDINIGRKDSDFLLDIRCL